MTFATEAAKRTSHRWMLVRITPRRHVSDDLSASGGGVYTMTFPFPISSIERNGNELTRVEDTLVSNDEWIFDETTGTVDIKLAAAPNSSTNIIVIKYMIFLTTSQGEHWHETPTDTTSDLRLWVPRISSFPEINQSIRNITSGVFTIEQTTLTIENTDFDFQKYLTDSDSFSDAPVKMWVCLNSNSTATKVYEGICQDPTSIGETVELTVLDAFSRLNQPAYFGDTADEAHFYREASSFPSMDSRRHGSPVRLIIGEFSRYKTKPGGYLYMQEDLDHEYMEEATCTDYSINIQTYNNRQWGICRTLDGLRTPTMQTRKTVSPSGDLTLVVFTATNWQTLNILIGTTAKIGSNYARLIRVNDPGGGSDVTTYWRTDASTTPGHTTATSWTMHAGIELCISDGSNTYYPLYTRDYTLTTTTTSGGNSYHKITFVNGFETTLAPDGSNYFGDSISLGLDPGKHRVFFRVCPTTTNITHAKVMKRIIEDSGLTALASTFTQADSDFSANVLMSVPWFDEDEFASYLDYAEAIAGSTLGYVFANTDGEAEYHLLSDPVPTDTRTIDEMISLNIEYSYADIVTRIISYNPHDYADSESVGSSVTSDENTLSKVLYAIDRPTQFRHVLDSMSSRIAAHLAVKSKPIKTLTFSTATMDFQTSINDDLTIESDQIPGGSAAVKVIGTRISIENTSVQTIVVEGT